MSVDYPPSDHIKASLFNGYVGSSVVFALSEIGFFKLFEKNDSVVNLPRAAGILKVRQNLLTALCDNMVAIGILQNASDDSYALTIEGQNLAELLGYFTWAIGGYGNLLHNLHHLVSGRKTYGYEVVRDESYVARGAGEVGQKFVLPVVASQLDKSSFNEIVDLGCGSAALLIFLCRRYPWIKGVGVDISEKACELARQRIFQSGLSERIRIIKSDVNQLAYGADSSEVSSLQRAEVVTSFFMLHDLIKNQAQAVDFFSNLKRNFCNTRYFLFGDTMQSDSLELLKSQKIFSQVFELVHAFMGHCLWKKQLYDEVFSAAGFAVDGCIRLDIPFSWLYVLKNEAVIG